jgi:hypothetical protein
MMEAVHSSETSVNIYQTTQHNIPEDNYLQYIFHILQKNGSDDPTHDTKLNSKKYQQQTAYTGM